jgi:heme/copper-type cytochrome/quinol oxidase subunit 2
VQRSEGRYARVVERYLVRRHNARLLEEGLLDARATCQVMMMMMMMMVVVVVVMMMMMMMLVMVVERYLVRRHNARLLEEGLLDARAT